MTSKTTRTTLQFSGHETFTLHPLWLYKAVGYAKEACTNDAPLSLSSEDAMLKLGVGKNMVSSMFYWAKACGFLTSENKPTALADQIFISENPLDPFEESVNTAWIAHWNLAAQKEKCTAVWYIFNQINKPSFSRQELTELLEEFAQENNFRTSLNTIRRAVEVALRSYIPNASSKSKHTTEDFGESLFTDLGIIQFDSLGAASMVRSEKRSLHPAVFAYALLDYWNKNKPSTTTLNFSEISNSPGSPGKIFKLDEQSTTNYLEMLEDLSNGELIWTEQSGLRSVSRKGKAVSEPDSVLASLLSAAYKN